MHQICIQQNVTVHGTLWLVEKIVESKTATVQTIEQAYEKMQEDGSRLPWDEVKKQLDNFKNKV